MPVLVVVGLFATTFFLVLRIALSAVIIGVSVVGKTTESAVKGTTKVAKAGVKKNTGSKVATKNTARLGKALEGTLRVAKHAGLAALRLLRSVCTLLASSSLLATIALGLVSILLMFVLMGSSGGFLITLAGDNMPPPGASRVQIPGEAANPGGGGGSVPDSLGVPPNIDPVKWVQPVPDGLTADSWAGVDAMGASIAKWAIYAIQDSSVNWVYQSPTNGNVGHADCTYFVGMAFAANGYSVTGKTVKVHDYKVAGRQSYFLDVGGSGSSLANRMTRWVKGTPAIQVTNTSEADWKTKIKPGDIMVKERIGKSGHAAIYVGVNEAGNLVSAHASSKSAELWSNPADVGDASKRGAENGGLDQVGFGNMNDGGVSSDSPVTFFYRPSLAVANQ